MPELAVIGGTGVYETGFLADVKTHRLLTPYGTAEAQIGRLEGADGNGCGPGRGGDRGSPPLEVVFMTRHGAGHSVPPHRVNYRANIWALRALGVTRVFGTGAVGSLREHMAPGDCVLVSDFLDFVRERPSTFFEGDAGAWGVAGGGATDGGRGGSGGATGGGGGFGVVHTDVSEPYCPELREALRLGAGAAGVPVHDGGSYVCTSGPRFETPAEIRMFRQLGADVVGMTNVPEVVLARELGMCYGLIAVVTNYAAGISRQPLTHHEVVEVMRENVRKLRAVVRWALELLPAERRCACGRNLIAVAAPATPADQGPVKGAGSSD